jgi:hypothetical protein
LRCALTTTLPQPRIEKQAKQKSKREETNKRQIIVVREEEWENENFK